MSDSFKVVINHEEQYSIWPADRENPPLARKSNLSPFSTRGRTATAGEEREELQTTLRLP